MQSINNMLVMTGAAVTLQAIGSTFRHRQNRF
jgi:hypothetical protein